MIGSDNLFRSYGVASALILIIFLLINYFVAEKADKKDGDNAEGGFVAEGGIGASARGPVKNGESHSYLDETTYLAPSGTPFIPASRTASAARNISSVSDFDKSKSSSLSS